MVDAYPHGWLGCSTLPRGLFVLHTSVTQAHMSVPPPRSNPRLRRAGFNSALQRWAWQLSGAAYRLQLGSRRHGRRVERATPAQTSGPGSSNRQSGFSLTRAACCEFESLPGRFFNLFADLLDARKESARCSRGLVLLPLFCLLVLVALCVWRKLTDP